MEEDFQFDAIRQRKGLELMLDGCRKGKCLYVAESDKQVVGMCSAQTVISTAEGGIVALIEDVVVLPQWQGKGIGRTLMKEIEKWAKSRGATHMQLLADNTNVKALGFMGSLDGAQRV